MKFLEKDLEQIIYENLQTEDSISDLISKGLDCAEGTWKIFRQLKIGNYGVADLVTVEKPIYIPKKERSSYCGDFIDPLTVTIYELKKDGVSVSAFLQAVRYAAGIRRFLSHKNIFRNNMRFRIVLIGNTINTASDLIYLTDFIDYTENFSLKFYTYKYGLNGIEFNQEEGYVLRNEGFNLKKAR